jgi:hypothetical protein
MLGPFELIRRCQDRTENGTFMSGLKCLKCPDGYYLADSPLDCASNWTCTLCRIQAPQVHRAGLKNTVDYSLLHCAGNWTCTLCKIQAPQLHRAGLRNTVDGTLVHCASNWTCTLCSIQALQVHRAGLGNTADGSLVHCSQ